MTVPVVTIDGPSASGKGTVARSVAARLGFHYLESGALYRLVALVSVRRGIDPWDLTRLARVAEELDVAFMAHTILLSGEDVTAELGEEGCGNRASMIAQLPAVRVPLLERQRQFRAPPGLVADGRDMGTAVFPDACLKVFLTANVAVRALRRYNQLKEKGIDANLQNLSRDLEERDRRDAARAASPLRPAPDAVQLDSSDLSIDEVVALVLIWYRERTHDESY